MTCVKSVKWRKTYFLYFCKSGDELLPVVGTFWVRIEIRPLFASSLCWNLKFQETIIYVSCFKCLLETDLFWNDQLSNINVSFVWLCSYSNWNLMINLKPVFKEFLYYLLSQTGRTDRATYVGLSRITLIRVILSVFVSIYQSSTSYC